MSKTIIHFLHRNPLLLSYAKEGLVNLTALAKYIKKNTFEFGSIAAVSMELRRYLSKQSYKPLPFFDFTQYSLQIVLRSNIREFIFEKTQDNREQYLSLLQRISKTKSFASMIEGEKEVVVMTDMPMDAIDRDVRVKQGLVHSSDGLGFISINFPIELRSVPGVYFSITSCLAQALISIQSFHTIGGEILILVKDEDLLRTQEVLKDLFTD